MSAPETSLQSDPQQFRSSQAEADSRPTVFGRDRSLFGLFKPSAAPTTRHVAVICNAIGFESIRLHKSIRALATALSDAGCASLRFDYSSTGDSGGEHATSADDWLEDIEDAVDEARRLAACDQVFLIGFRLGGLLARIAADRLSLAGLVLVQPHVSGREAVREMQIMQASASKGSADLQSDDGVDAGGFWYSQDVVASLNSLDLMRSVPESRVPTLLLESDSRAKAGLAKRVLAKHLTKLRSDIFDGYLAMQLPPRRSIVSHDLIGRISDWLAATSTTQDPAGSETQKPAVTSKLELMTGVDGIVERPAFFGPSADLFGILTLPDDPAERSGLGVILVCGGAVHRVSANRMYVPLARQLARSGHCVLRFDLSGIGDSRSTNNAPQDHAYSPYFDRDLVAARDLLASKTGITMSSYVGLCSGAYVAMQAALRDESAVALVSINQLVYFLAQDKLAAASRGFPQKTRMLDYPAAGKAPNRIGRKLALKLHRFAPGAASWMSGVILGGHLPALLERLEEKLETVAFGVSDDDAASELLELFARRKIATSDSLTVARFEAADHIFTAKADQEALVDWVVRLHAPYAQSGRHPVEQAARSGPSEDASQA